MVELLAKAGNGLKPLTTSTKHPILDIWQESEYPYEGHFFIISLCFLWFWRNFAIVHQISLDTFSSQLGPKVYFCASQITLFESRPEFTGQKL